MKAMRFSDSDDAAALIEENISRPQTGPGELLIQVYAAGVTSQELSWYPTTHSKSGEIRRGAIPGHEFSGVIADMGENDADFIIGQEIYGMNDWFTDGATAEFCIAHPSCIAPKPARLTHPQAASVPIGALTAWQGLFDRAKLQAGENLLVQGGAGSVGLFAIQLARRHGAHVTATASAQNIQFVSQLGAERVIDYHTLRFEQELASSMDVVFDSVGGETLRRSWSVLKPGGRMITIATESGSSDDERIKQAFFIVEPNRDQLIRIGALLETGQLQTVVDSVLPFSQAAAAYAGKITQRQRRGKLVIAVAGQSCGT